jgi:hypothetical protein
MDLRAIAELVPADPALGSSHSEIQLEGPPFEGSAFAVQTAADLSVGAAVSAAVDLGLTRGLPPTDPPVLNRGQTLGAFSGRITVNGEPPSNCTATSPITLEASLTILASNQSERRLRLPSANGPATSSRPSSSTGA